MFEEGMKVRKNSEMSDDEIREQLICASTNRALVKRIIAGEVFTLEDYDHPHTRFEEHGGDAPWVPIKILELYNSALEGVEEL